MIFDNLPETTTREDRPPSRNELTERPTKSSGEAPSWSHFCIKIQTCLSEGCSRNCQRDGNYMTLLFLVLENMLMSITWSTWQIPIMMARFPFKNWCHCKSRSDNSVSVCLKNIVAGHQQMFGATLHWVWWNCFYVVSLLSFRTKERLDVKHIEISD